jgi:hypothetical protein
MDKLNLKIIELYEKYKENPNTIAKLDFYVTKQLPGLLEKFYKSEKRKIFLEKESHKYINEFLTNPEKQYFYIKNTDLFIYYNSENYTIINEDDLWMTILTDITSKNILLNYKQKIKNVIVENIKSKSLFQTIPESHTVQDVINFFTPTLFETKQDVKHFMSILGDNILNKNSNLLYFVIGESKHFFDMIEELCEFYFNSKLNITSCIRYRYRGEKYDKSRIIYFKKSIKNISCWRAFLKNNIFNLLVICCHYSTRYISADNYVTKQNTIFKNKIFHLKNNSKSKLIDNFILNELIDKENSKISFNDMFFLWKIYLKNKNITNIILKSEFEEIMKSKSLFHLSNFTNIKSKYLDKVKLYKKFWNSNILYDTEEELEISELYVLILSWLQNKNIAEYNFTEENIKDMIEYFNNDIVIKKNKFLIGIKCKLWDKQTDIIEAFQNKFNKNIQNDISKYESYILYCKYANNNSKLLTASKSYFFKFIETFIQSEYLNDEVISIKYWEK